MPYTYQIDPQAMFEDRTGQFHAFGIPLEDIEGVRARVTDMWADAPGGWVYEWSGLAAGYAQQGNPYLSSIAYGCAKFPCLADDARNEALQNQLTEFLAAAPSFPLHFERRTLTLSYRGSAIDIPVHLYSVTGDYSTAPVWMASGGVDTWKMDIHPWWVAFALNTGVTVLAFDHPGTGEFTAPLDGFADEAILGIAKHAKAIGDGRVAHLGVSFGGNFSAMTGLTAAVDAAIVLGGPVQDSFHSEHLDKLPYGMKDIVGNAMGFDHPATTEELVAAAVPLSRRELLGEHDNGAMLVINGADDPFIPVSDTEVFQGRSQTEVHLIPDTGHCAMTKVLEILPMMMGWISHQFGTTPSDATRAAAAR